MSNETKAALQTLKFVGSIAIGTIILLFLSTVFGPETVTWTLIASLFIFSTWIIYSINLSNLKYKEKEQFKKTQQ